MILRLAALALAPLLFAGASLAGSFDVAAFERDVQQALDATGVPGVGIAVIKDGAVIYEGGLGYRDADAQLPVTARTVFMAGSTTKAFTGTALTLLAAERPEFSLTAPVKEYLPDFRVSDPIATEHATTVDLLTHRSGMARHDLVWYESPLSREEIYQNLHALQTNYEFRDATHYNNLAYLVAGILLEREDGEARGADGASWERAIQRRILDPLGMTDSSLTIAELKASPDHSLPYEKTADGKVVAREYVSLTNVAPAGALNTTPHDMALWIRAQLGNGRLDGREVFPESVLRTAWAPRVVFPKPDVEVPGCVLCGREFSAMTYGFGWGNYHYRGHRTVWHNGGIDGFLTHVSFMPDDGLGVVVFANATHVDLPLVVTLLAYDRLLAAPRTDWLARATAETPRAETCDGESLAIAHPEAYVGTYAHPAYERVRVTLEGTKLMASIHGLPAGEVFKGTDGKLRIRGMEKGQCEVTFAHDGATGKVTQFAATLEPSVSPIVFMRED